MLRRAMGWQEGCRARLAQATWENPVLVKELRTRMRGTRAYWILFGYTLLIAAILAFIYHLFVTSFRPDSAELPGSRAGELGRVMYGAVFVTQAIMVALITPAITAGAVTLEREQRSYELLATTRLGPADVIRGKLAAAVSFAVLLVTSTLPLASLSFLVGGVSPGEIACSYGVVVAAAFLYGTIGIFWSSTVRTTAGATVATYLTVLGLFIATMVPGVVALERGFTGSGAGPAPEVPFQSLNPLMAAFTGVHGEYWFAGEAPSWISAMVLMVLAGALLTQQAMARLEHFVSPRPAWPRACATLLWTAFAFSLAGPLLGEALHRAAPLRTGSASLAEAAALLFVLGGILLAVLSAVLNTGPRPDPAAPRPTVSYLAGLLPHRMLRAELAGGLTLILTWALLFIGILVAGLAAGGRLAALDPEAMAAGAMVLLAMVFGLGGLGHAISRRARTRWQALILTLAATVALIGLPYGALAPLAEHGVRPSPLWAWLYTVPFESFVELGGSQGLWPSPIPMPFRPLWPVTVGFYMLLGMGGLMYAAVAVRLRAGHMSPDRGSRAAGEGSR